MKKLILIPCLLIAFTTLKAQSDTLTTAQHQVGINIRSIVGFFDFGFFVAQPSPYALNYQFSKKKFGVRAAFGGNFNNLDRDNSDGFDNNQKVRDFNYKLGFNYMILNKSRFIARAGIDGIRRDFLSIYDSSDLENTNFYETKSTENGFGPTLTLEFKINDFISVSTEASFYFDYLDQDNIRTNNGVTTTETIKGWTSDVYEPSIIYLNVRF